MRRHQPPAGKYAAGICLCRQIQCGQIFPDQCPDEPQVLCQNLVPAGKDADHSILQHQSGAVLCGSAWIRLRKGFSGGQGQVGKDDRAVSAEIPMLKLVFLLVDIRHEPSANDKMMYDWVVSNGYHPVIIATKLDKIQAQPGQPSDKSDPGRSGRGWRDDHCAFSAQTKQEGRRSGIYGSGN